MQSMTFPSASPAVSRNCVSPWQPVQQTERAHACSQQSDRFEPSLGLASGAAATPFELSTAAKVGLGVMGLAAFASPTGAFAATHTDTTPALTSISKTLAGPGEVVSNSLATPEQASEALASSPSSLPTPPAAPQGSPQTNKPTTTTVSDDVPWYEPVNSRAREVNDSLVGFKDGVAGYGVRMSDRLNNNPVSQFHPQGELGDYHYNVEVMRFKIDPYLSLQANKAGFGSRDELALVRGSVVERGTTHGYDYTQGVRGEIEARRDMGIGTQLNIHGFQHDDLNGRFFGTRIEGFEQMRHQAEHGWSTTLDASLGETTNFLDGSTNVYARALGRADNKDLGEKWIRPGAVVRTEVEVGAQHNFGDHTSTPYYRVYGGAEYPVHFELKGKTHTVDLETGLVLQGDRNQAVQLRPEVRARLQW